MCGDVVILALESKLPLGIRYADVCGMPLGEAKLSQIQKSLLDAAYGWRALTVHVTLL